MLDTLIFKLMRRKERDKFFEAFGETVSTDEFVEYLREFSLNPKGDTEVMKAFRKWLKNRKKYL